MHVAGSAAALTAAAAPAPESTRASFRAGGRSHVDLPWDDVDPEAVAAGAPWRHFRWYKGQTHYSGTYWSSTECSHVVYESRLELARLLQADFDVAVRRIAAQPFLLRAYVGGVERKHVPDFLLLTESGPVVVDVKPPGLAQRSRTAFAFAWKRRMVERRGWRYEVWTGAERVELENLLRPTPGVRADEPLRDGLFRTSTTSASGSYFTVTCTAAPGACLAALVTTPLAPRDRPRATPSKAADAPDHRAPV